MEKSSGLPSCTTSGVLGRRRSVPRFTRAFTTMGSPENATVLCCAPSGPMAVRPSGARVGVILVADGAAVFRPASALNPQHAVHSTPSSTAPPKLLAFTIYRPLS